MNRVNRQCLDVAMNADNLGERIPGIGKQANGNPRPAGTIAPAWGSGDER